jgi:site-specific DNA-methyltransferase (adenine-specific)
MIDQHLNKIYNMDCLAFMKTLPDKCIDLVLTDPPYGIGELWVGGKGHGWGKAREQGEVRNEWDSKTPSQEVFDEIIRVSKNQIIWGGNYFNLPISRGWLIWNKPERGFSLAEAELAWTSRDMVIRVFDCHRSDTGRTHPTQKPLNLMEWCLTFFPDALTVFDPFLGSGTTAVACKQLGRNFIGCEISPEYCKIAQQRLDSMTQSLF